MHGVLIIWGLVRLLKIVQFLLYKCIYFVSNLTLPTIVTPLHYLKYVPI